MTNPPFKKTTIASFAIPSMLHLQSQAMEAILSAKGKAPARTEPYTYDMPDSDATLIGQIVSRALEILRMRGMPPDHPLDVPMMVQDISTVHCNVTPLRLLQWLMSDQSDFMRDFAGLSLHLDRRAGVFVCDWWPMFAKAPK